MNDPHDSLIPLLMLPVVYAELFLVIYFIGRFVVENAVVRLVKVSIALVVAGIVFVLPGDYYWWEGHLGGEETVLILFGALLVGNVVFSIWYKV